MKNGPIKCALISLTPRAIVVNHTRILHGAAGRRRVCNGVKFRADGALAVNARGAGGLGDFRLNLDFHSTVARFFPFCWRSLSVVLRLSGMEGSRVALSGLK